MSSSADILLIVHAAWVLFIVLMLPLIALGGLLKWRWIRGNFLRTTHLGMMGIVAFEAVLSITCPLTILENQLRIRSGSSAYKGGFVARILSRIIYHEWTETTFLVIYIVILALILGLYVFIPPNWLRGRLENKNPVRRITPP